MVQSKFEKKTQTRIILEHFTLIKEESNLKIQF